MYIIKPVFNKFNINFLSEIPASVFHEDEFDIDVIVFELREALNGEFKLATVI